jgi:cobalt-zinc-cadmium efflux system protein
MSRSQRLAVVFALNFGLVIALVTIGVSAHSLAVLAEGGDYLLDAAGAALALLAIRTRTPAVHGLPVLVVSGVAALAMTAGVLVLRADDDDAGADDAGAGHDGGRDLSVAAVMLDTVADAAAAAGVAAAGGIILATGGWHWLDPAVALVIAVIIGYHALALLRKVVNLVTN